MKLANLPGFKSGSRIRNVLVGIVYFFAIMMVIGAIVGPAEEPVDPVADASTPTIVQSETASSESPNAQPTVTPESTEIPTDEPTEQPASGYEIQVSCECEWSGSFGGLGDSRTVDGSGSETIDVTDEHGYGVTAVVQKQGASGEELLVQIIKDGSVVKEQSTTADYGVVSING